MTSTLPPFASPTDSNLPLSGVRVLSLALNLPGPATLLRCQAMGACCTKLEPPAPVGHASADAMHAYSPAAYAQLHAGIHVLQADLKTQQGQDTLHAHLAQTDVVLTSFRASALLKLGLDFANLQAIHPQLNMVRIWGNAAPEARNTAGHDLTYQAEAGLLNQGQLPASLFADMGGALMGSEAVLQTLLLRMRTGHGHCMDIGLAQAAQWLALPRHWQMTTAQGDVGGAHAGYRIYACANGMVAAAALEPHFAQRLCALAGFASDGSIAAMRQPSTHEAIGRFLSTQTCAALETAAHRHDIPLHPLCTPPQPTPSCDGVVA